MNNVEFNFVRGDTYQRTITIVWNQEITNVYFTLKKNENDKDVVLQKKLGSGITLVEQKQNEDGSNTYTYLLNINATDTDNLETNYGYFFDFEVISDTIKKTPIKGTLTLDNDITRTINEV